MDRPTADRISTPERSALLHAPDADAFRGAVPLLFLALTLLVTACGGETTSKPDLEPTVRPVKIHTVTAGDAPATREYPGNVEAAEQASLAFEMPGRVVEMAVQEGETVEEGDVIARLEPDDVQARVRAAVANRNAARSAYERAKKLYERDVIPLQQLEARRRDYQVADSEVETAREALTDTRLTAPFRGEVARTFVETNETIGAQKPVAVVQDLTRMEVVVDVPEQDQLRRTLRDETFFVSLAMLPGQEFPARLTEMSTSADPVTRTFEATFAFDPPNNADILPGMTARVVTEPPSVTRPGTETADQAPVPAEPVSASAAESETDRSLTVPASAVFASETGQSSVWVIDPSSMKVSERAVDLGPRRDTLLTIENGLTEGEKIAVTGVHQLNEGRPVRPFSR